MKYLKILLLFLSPLFATAQPLGTWPVQYGDTPPTHTPSGSGTRIYLNISTNELYNWNPAPVSSWVKYPKGFDQISGCSSPGYTPTARQSVFAVNSCTALQNGRGPELYQYTGSQWVCLNCYPAYTAGTGIGISSGVISNTAPDQVVSISGVGITPSGAYPNFTLTAADQSATNELQTLSISGQNLTLSNSGGTVAIPSADGSETKINVGSGLSKSGSGTSGSPYVLTNTGDLSTTNELNTAFSVTGGNLRLVDAAGNLDVPVSSIAPVQSVFAGSGITISGVSDITINADDNSPTNELQTLSLDGNDLTLSDGGGTVTLPGGASDALGTGFTSGGGSGTIPDNTAASWGGSTALTTWGADGYNVTEWNAGDIYAFSQFGPDGTVFGYSNSTSGQSASVSYVADGLYGVDVSTSNIGQRYFSENGNILYQVSGTGAIEINAGTKIFALDSGGDKFQVTDNGDGKGMTYNDYYPNIETNDNSFTSTRNVNALKQTPVSYTNAAAPANTIFYSTTDSKLSYKDPGGTVHGLY